MTLDTIVFDKDDADPWVPTELDDAISDAIGTPLVEVLPDPLGTCPGCDGEIYNIDHREGPDAPEVGWEYIECPKCGTTTRPEAFK